MIEVSDYDTRWADEFSRSERELRQATGALFVTIEHIGSTAVPGLAAKPIIDILAAVPRLEDVETHLPALTELASRLVDAGMPGRLFLRRDTDGRRTHHLHVVTVETFDTRNERLLRDHLRTHPELADEYARLKRTLAAGALRGPDYTRAKTAFVQRVVDAARNTAGLPRVDVWES